MASYQWRATTDFRNLDDPDYLLSHGVTPNYNTNWQTDEIGTDRSGTWTFWFRDSNTSFAGQYVDTISSRCNIKVAEQWSTSVDSLNNLTVTCKIEIGPIYRDDAKGGDKNTPGREIHIYREQGGGSFIDLYDYQIAENHTLYDGAYTLAQFSFTLAPGQSIEKSSLYAHNQTIGYESYDDLWIGVQFKNTLPNPTNYTLSYNANGGSGAPSAQSTTTGASSATFTVSSTKPTWGLYEFLGWSSTQYSDSRTEADVEYSAGSTITLAQGSPSKTIYAVWRKDYRPGAVRDGSGIWQSHNRTGGTCHVLKNSTWQECRTIGAPTAMGNPPSVLHDGKWYNMARIGKGKG